jgi:hypothetical protein
MVPGEQKDGLLLKLQSRGFRLINNLTIYNMALIEDQPLPTTIEDVNIAAFTPDINKVTSQFAEFYGAPSAATTPAGPGALPLPVAVPGFSGPTQTITGPSGDQFSVGPTGITPLTPSVASPAAAAVSAGAAPFDINAFMESSVPSVDPNAYATALEQQLATLGETEDFVAGELAGETVRRESEIQDELAIQQASLESMYAPRYDEVERGLLRAQESAAFGSAAAGSVRGSRAAQKQVDLSQQAAKAEQALAAEQGMQLRLIEAELRGEPDAVLDALKDRVSSLSTTRQQLQTQMVLAEEELLGIQATIAAEVQEKQLQMHLDNLAAQGLTMDPFTGETITSLVGQEMKSNLALQDAQTAEIYAQLQQPDLQVEYFNDEMGNTYANLVDLKTGTLETIDLGRLNPAQKWAIEALNAPVMSGYGGSGGGTVAGTGTGGADIEGIAKQLMKDGETVGSLYSSIKSGGELSKELSGLGFSSSQKEEIMKTMSGMEKSEPSAYYYGQALGEALPLVDMANPFTAPKTPPGVPQLPATTQGLSNIFSGLKGFFGF